MKYNSLDYCYLLTRYWHKRNKITINGNSRMQTIKLGEEYGELCSAVARNDKELLKDSIGDMLVVLTAIAELEKLDLSECWKKAYNEIKDRRGVLLPNGNFLKKEDWKCNNCKHFLENLCSYHQKKVQDDDTCDNWEVKDNK